MHPTHYRNHQPPAVPEYMLALLIGGPFDGDRLTVARDVDHIQRIESKEVDVMPAPYNNGVTSFKSSLHTYWRQHWNLSDGVSRGEFALYIHETIRPDVFDVVQALIMGYRQPKEPGQW